MKEKFINFYKKELGVWNMVYKHMNRLIFILYVLSFVILISLSFKHFVKQYSEYFLYCSICIIILLTLLIIHIRKIITDKYGKGDQGYLWGGEHYFEVRKKELKKYVLTELESDKMLESLIENLKKEAERRKFKGFTVRGLGIGLFIPLWNAIINWSFNSTDVLTEAIALFVIFFMIIILIIMYAVLFKTLTDDILNRDYYKINGLINMLEEIVFEGIDFNKKIIR